MTNNHDNSVEEFELLVSDPQAAAKNPASVHFRAPTRVGRNLVIMSIASLFVGLVIIHIYEKPDNLQLLSGKSKSSTDDEVTLFCPNNLKKSENDKDAMLTEFYAKGNNKSDIFYPGTNKIDADKLKNTIHDGWDSNYYDLKKLLYKWKSQRFSSLKSGDKIFESGCGIGTLHFEYNSCTLHTVYISKTFWNRF